MLQKAIVIQCKAKLCCLEKWRIRKLRSVLLEIPFNFPRKQLVIQRNRSYKTHAQPHIQTRDFVIYEHPKIWSQKCANCLQLKSSDERKMSQQSNSATTLQQPALFQQPAAGTRSDVVTYKTDGNGYVDISGNVYQQKFSRLPRRTPVDLQFENIGYTASLGFRKGKAFFNSRGPIS
jgi:hypothetical protein